MQRLRTARRRCLVSMLTIGLASLPGLTGCGSGDGSSSSGEQATKGHEAAKSSMEYMRKHIAETKTASKAHRKGP